MTNVKFKKKEKPRERLGKRPLVGASVKKDRVVLPKDVSSDDSSSVLSSDLDEFNKAIGNEFGDDLLSDEGRGFKELGNQVKAKKNAPAPFRPPPPSLGAKLDATPPPMSSRPDYRRPSGPQSDPFDSDVSSVISAMSQSKGIDPAIKIAAEKQDILSRLNRLKKDGWTLSKNFTMRSSIDDLRLEIGRIEFEADKQRSIKYQRRLLMMAVTGTEFVNVKYGPNVFGFKGKLNKWSESVLSEIDSYDGVFERLHEKYQATGRGFASPEVELATMIVQSMFMFVLNQNLMQAAMPNPEQILKDNPELVEKLSKQLKESARQKEREVEAFDRMQAEQRNRGNPNVAYGGPEPPIFGGTPSFFSPQPPPHPPAMTRPTPWIRSGQPQGQPPQQGLPQGLPRNPINIDAQTKPMNFVPPPPNLADLGIPGVQEVLAEMDVVAEINNEAIGMLHKTEIEEVLPSNKMMENKLVQLPDAPVGTRKGRRVRQTHIKVTQEAPKTKKAAEKEKANELILP